MYGKNLICGFLLLITLSACSSSATAPEQTENGITITLPSDETYSPKQVRLEVISENIIRVTSSPKAPIPLHQSLMIRQPLPTPPKWELAEGSDSLGIITTSLQAWVSKNTGEVTFFDAHGKKILKEAAQGKSFGAADGVEDQAIYEIAQSFESSPSEALYGLGQQQTGLMNYKGYHVDLTQYNSSVAVPFLVSSRNFALLWDNYSITKFGDDRAPLSLSELRLYDKKGKEGFLTATYANDQDYPDEGLVQQEGVIAYAFLEDMDKIPAEFDMEKGVATWEGKIQGHSKGTHRFYMTYSGYIKVWVNGELLLDRWRESWNPGPAVFSISLDSQTTTNFKMEWIPESSQSFLSLKFLPPNPTKTEDTFTFRSEAGKILDYYFVAGENMDELIAGYRLLTGKAQVMPKWAFGFWQSRERYKTQEQVLNTVAEFRSRQIPLDNIVQDWSYWPEDAWGSHEFEASRFPDPDAMISKIHDEYHARFMISVWPKFYEGIAHYKEFDEKGWLYKQNIINRQRDWIGQGYISTFYDAYQPEARKLFWKQIDEKLFSKGVDAWWLDATEPDILSNASIEHRKSLMNPTAVGSATEFFNGYPLVNAKGIYEGQRSKSPDQRVFILTRSAFPGIQRYGAATWSGDIASRFDELEQQIPAGLNFSLSGLPYWTTDIGGFFVEDKYDRPDPKGEALEEWRELNTRWYQYGTFTPLYRSHGQYPFREVFNIAPENHLAYQSIVFYNKLRYRLMPYIYSLGGMVHHDDYTIMRPLVMDFPGDQKVLLVKDQFMFGPSILVNPVYKYQATEREVYFPKGTGWYDLLTGKYQEGGSMQTVQAPYEKIPLYVPEGSIIPFGPEIQYTDQLPASEITIYVYAGKDGQFSLYEDEGTNYDYEEGHFATIPFEYTDSTGEFTIGERKGQYAGMLSTRTFHLVLVTKNNAVPLDFDLRPHKTVAYDGNALKVKLK